MITLTINGLVVIFHMETEMFPIWFKRAMHLEKEGRISQALDVIYSNMDSLFMKGKFEDCDALLSEATKHRLPVHIILALLTTTLPAAHLLPSRTSFYQESAKKLAESGEMEPGLLDGLGS